MTDFFDRLVMKILGRDVVLEPVILTPFEESGDLADMPPFLSKEGVPQEPADVSRDDGAFSPSSPVPLASPGDHVSPKSHPFQSLGRGRATGAPGGRKEAAQRNETQRDTTRRDKTHKDKRRDNEDKHRDNERPEAVPYDLGPPNSDRAPPMGQGGESRDDRRAAPPAIPSADNVLGENVAAAAMGGDAIPPREPPAALRRIRSYRDRDDLPPLPARKNTPRAHHGAGDDGDRPDRKDDRPAGIPAHGVDDLTGREPQRDGASPAPAARLIPPAARLLIPEDAPATLKTFSPLPHGRRRTSPGNLKLEDGKEDRSAQEGGGASFLETPSPHSVSSSVRPDVFSRERVGRVLISPQVRDGGERVSAKPSPPSPPTPLPSPPVGAAIPPSSARAEKATGGQIRGGRDAATGEGDARGDGAVEIRIDRIDVRENPAKAGKVRDGLPPGPSLTVDAYIARRQGRLSSGGEHE